MMSLCANAHVHGAREEYMDLNNYFETHTGTGVLATADAQGFPNAALYSRPHFMEDGTVAFVMNDRLSHRNLEENRYAAFIFVESGTKRDGIRLYMEKLRETDDPAEIEKYRRHRTGGDEVPGKKRFLVFFRIEKTRPLVEPDPAS